MRYHYLIITVTFTSALLDSAAHADTSPIEVKNLLACRAQTDSQARLNCYDEATKSLDLAMKKQDIIIVDPPKIAKAQKSIFGLNLANIGELLGYSPTSSDKDERNDIDFIDAKIARAYPVANRGWVLILDDGARWVQVDTRPLAAEPHSGSAIHIKRAAMGSFLANIDGQIAIRVKREN